MNKGFVIMPFGVGFDDLYEKIYAPVIRKVGLEPLRADEIYDNRPIIQDIQNSIHNAKVILADVTGRNPNVNYELGAAHALNKEVIILTANSQDVPSDYRHIRYIEYNRHDIDWNKKLSDTIEKTLHTVLNKIDDTRKSDLDLFEYPGDEYKTCEEENFLEDAKSKGFKNEYFNQESSTLSYKDNYIEINLRTGESDIELAAITYLINEMSLLPINQKLPKGHHLKMRSVFIDNYASHSFDVDYIYESGSLPLFTEKELLNVLSNDFRGQVFEPQIRFLEEDTKNIDFKVNADKYYKLMTLPEERKPISWRKGYYVAEIEDVYVLENNHCFYRLKRLLPLNVIGANNYVPEESHWLADWGQLESRCFKGDIVSFKVDKVYSVTNRGHAVKARNINFSELKLISKKLS